MSNLLSLALVCLRIGAFVFGGGPVIIPLLEPDVVYRYHWLTKHQFLDAVALGQMTPGPLLVTATFVGYKVGGLLAAVVATISIFLPAFIMTVIASSSIGRLKQNEHFRDFLWGVRAAVVGLIFSAVISLAQTGVTGAAQAAIGLAALALLLWKKVDGGLVIIGCGLIGMILWS